MIVTLFAWIAHRLQSSKRWTRKSSVASCIARRLSAVYLKGSGETSLEISRTCWIARLVRAEVTWQGGVPGKKRTYQATERSFPDEKVCAFLKFSNFFQCKSPWFVSSPPFLWCMFIAGVSVVCGFFPGFFTFARLPSLQFSSHLNKKILSPADSRR
jgi:hypothetical protein